MFQPSSAADGNLTPKDVQELREVFELFDKDKDGSITSQELRTVLNALRLDTTDQETMDMISSIDLDGNGTVDFEEFLRMMSNSYGSRVEDPQRLERVEEEEMRHAFRIFDMDGNGFIDARELKLTMGKLGENLTDKEVKRMMKLADKNRDGKIDYEEFLQMMYHK